MLNSAILSPAELLFQGMPIARVELVELDGKLAFQVCKLIAKHQAVSQAGSHS